MKSVFRKLNGKQLFESHPFALGRYYLINIAFFSSASIAVLYFTNLFASVSYWWLFSLLPLFLTRLRYILLGSVCLVTIVVIQYWSTISIYELLLVPAGIYLGHITAVFIHNAAHNNIRPYILNTIIGELCALQQLSAGLPVWQLVHIMHHVHSDDPKLDPHPPKGYSFFEFIDSSRLLIQKRLENSYYSLWGVSEESKKRWKQQNILLVLSRFAKTLFIFSLLGPKLFAFFFLPSYVANVLFFACFNYYAHQTNENGHPEIRNLSGNVYYWIGNRIFFGFFYHKNHHQNPKLFNPMRLKPPGTKD